MNRTVVITSLAGVLLMGIASNAAEEQSSKGHELTQIGRPECPVNKLG